jgi:hypothetical protein
VSVVTIKSLFCDCEHPNGPCIQWYGEEDRRTVTLLRQDARKHGWTIRRSQRTDVRSVPRMFPDPLVVGNDWSYLVCAGQSNPSVTLSVQRSTVCMYP